MKLCARCEVIEVELEQYLCADCGRQPVKAGLIVLVVSLGVMLALAVVYDNSEIGLALCGLINLTLRRI